MQGVLPLIIKIKVVGVVVLRNLMVGHLVAVLILTIRNLMPPVINKIVLFLLQLHILRLPLIKALLMKNKLQIKKLRHKHQHLNREVLALKLNNKAKK